MAWSLFLTGGCLDTWGCFFCKICMIRKCLFIGKHLTFSEWLENMCNFFKSFKRFQSYRKSPSGILTPSYYQTGPFPIIPFSFFGENWFERFLILDENFPTFQKLHAFQHPPPAGLNPFQTSSNLFWGPRRGWPWRFSETQKHLFLVFFFLFYLVRFGQTSQFCSSLGRRCRGFSKPVLCLRSLCLVPSGYARRGKRENRRGKGWSARGEQTPQNTSWGTWWIQLSLAQTGLLACLSLDPPSSSGKVGRNMAAQDARFDTAGPCLLWLAAQSGNWSLDQSSRGAVSGSFTWTVDAVSLVCHCKLVRSTHFCVKFLQAVHSVTNLFTIVWAILTSLESNHDQKTAKLRTLRFVVIPCEWRQ